MTEREADGVDAPGGTNGDAQCTAASGRRRPISMHENVSPWSDHCSCGAEPYWLEVAAELGIGIDVDADDAGGKA